MSAVDTNNYEEDVKKLIEECKKPKASHKLLKELMKSIFEGTVYFHQ